MNWIERLYELKEKDPYSQNGEGIYLEYILSNLEIKDGLAIDIGGGDGFNLSNTRYLLHTFLIDKCLIIDKENGHFITVDNAIELMDYPIHFDLLSIDIDGNDYWIIKEILEHQNPAVIIAEFNAAYGDSRTIKYNPNHVWQGDSYYGFSFHAGVKLAEANGYKVIFQNNDMNMYMVREDLIKVPIPPVTFKQSNYFKPSEHPDSDWVFV